MFKVKITTRLLVGLDMKHRNYHIHYKRVSYATKMPHGATILEYLLNRSSIQRNLRISRDKVFRILNYLNLLINLFASRSKGTTSFNVAIWFKIFYTSVREHYVIKNKPAVLTK